MSRIQEILAKAERDGTARRTPQTSTGSGMAATMTMPPDTVGSSALDRRTFMPASETEPRSAPPTASPARTEKSAAAMRTARPIFHPTLVAAIAPHAAVAEQYRTIRARLTQQEETGPRRTILVTSPGVGDGKSLTSANLALTMAQEFQSTVVLVDADLRHPSIHTLFGVEPSPGLSEVLSGEATLDQALIHLPDFRLTLLPAGNPPAFPTELLGSSDMRRTLDALRARFDRILLDLPAVMPLADVGTIAPLADGALMVVRAGVTPRPMLDQALATFDHDKVIGLVLNETSV